LLAAATVVAACTGIAPPREPPPEAAHAFVRVDWSALPGWSTDTVHEAWPAYEIGCRRLTARSASPWRTTCDAAAAIDPGDATAIRTFFESHFRPYLVRGPDGDRGLFTGYYEPLLQGARTRSERFAVPLFAVPDDLLIVDLGALHPEIAGKRVRGRLDGRRVVPYWNRAEIEAGNATRARPLAFVERAIDAFFLQIQGSGRIALDDGTTLRVGYADQNGHPYKAIGRVLVERGELSLDAVSLASIRAWGEQNPERLPALLDENPSYVFFREVAPPAPGSLEARIDGPLGSLGVPLLSTRTIAVDPRVIPLGAPVFVATTHPLTGRPLTRLTLAQDTGGAIRGAVRADFFFGAGDEAGRAAGEMRAEGRMWMLWPTGEPLPAPTR
jgi:membrane-bound lytic murein transglycosylase A